MRVNGFLRKGLVLFLLCLGLFAVVETHFATAAPTPAQSSAPAGDTEEALPLVPLGERIDADLKEWKKTLAQIDKTIASASRTDTERKGLDPDGPDPLEDSKIKLTGIINQAESYLKDMEPRLKEAERLLASLKPSAPSAATTDGAAAPAPAPSTTESDALTEQRKTYEKDLENWKNRQAQVNGFKAEADRLFRQIVEIQRQVLVGQLLSKTPSPLLPSSWAIAVEETIRVSGDLLAAPVDWMKLKAQDSQSSGNQALLIAGVWVTIGIIAGLILRWWVLRRFGRTPNTENPSYSCRLAAALGEGIANGILPALVLGGLIFWSTLAFTDNPLLLQTAKTSLIGLLTILLARGFTRAALAPGQPEWRISPHDDDQAKTLSFLFQSIAIVLSLNYVFVSIAEVTQMLPEALWVYQAGFKLIEGILLIGLCAKGLWNDQPDDDKEDDKSAPTVVSGYDDNVPAKGGEILTLIVRGIIIVMTVVGICAPFLRYGELGRFLINGLLVTCTLVVMGYLVRALVYELITLVTNNAWVRSRLGWGDKAWEQARFWLRAFFGLLIILGVGILVAPSWGVPKQDAINVLLKFLTGFEVGNVRISLLAIVIGISVFLVLMAVTRMIQNTLQKKVLVQTNMDVGVRNSLITGFGYLGVVISSAMGVAAMGIDLTNIALIAGALSVGIGFGLQNIVNNFVSGLILLVERPIKVGDWVNIGSNEGIVKRISFRATELETFSKASIIIPNASIISSPFTNLTHRNRLGRVSVVVRVAPGSDVEKVKSILLDAARNNDLVLMMPAPSVSLSQIGVGGDAVSGIPPASLVFTLNAHTSNILNGGGIASDMRLEINKRFQEENIQFA